MILEFSLRAFTICCSNGTGGQNYLVVTILTKIIVQHDINLLVIALALIDYTSSNLVSITVSNNTIADNSGYSSINGEGDLLETLQGSLH